MKVGLFFGSFNPVHIGHLLIAEYLLEFSTVDAVWMVISPQNPLKNAETLASEEDRLNMLHLALGEVDHKLQVCDVELGMPRPSYTIDTLKFLQKMHPEHQFVVIMGSDSLENLSKWKGYEELINGWDFCVYPREPRQCIKKFPSQRFVMVDAPTVGISSSQIRANIARGGEAIGQVSNDVWDYICRQKLYGYQQQFKLI